MKTLAQNARYSLRMMRKNPGFAAIAVITLALGIGANTAIFSVLYATLLAPLPYPNADRLMMVWSKINGRNQVSAGDYLEWKRRNTVFEDMAAWNEGNFKLSSVDQPELVLGRIVTPNFNHMQGMKFS